MGTVVSNEDLVKRPRFTCERCQVTLVMPEAGAVPAHWKMLWVHSVESTEDATPLRENDTEQLYLCSSCHGNFWEFFIQTPQIARSVRSEVNQT